LLKYDLAIRSSDEKYLFYVFRFLKKVCDMIKPYLKENGGPIIGVQVENEYGDAYVGDGEYLKLVRDFYIENGITSLFTSGWSANMNIACGSVDGVLHTINYRGPSAESQIKFLREYYPENPVMTMEYWTGRSTKEEVTFSHRDAEECAKYLKTTLDNGAHVNFYCFHGGTNFGFFNGANKEMVDGQERTVFQATSYDGDFPLNEYGAITEKYMLERQVISDFLGKELPAVNFNTNTRAYGEYDMQYSCDLFECPSLITASAKSVKPLPMEKVGEGYGYIVYSTKINFKQKGLVLSIEEVHDKASVYVNGKFIGIINRDEKEKLRFDATEEVTYIDILVENLGRINFGKAMETDAKGIIGNVCLNDKPIHGFTCSCYPLNKLPQSSGKQRAEGVRPAFYRATFNVDEIADTFVYPKNFKRCAVFINGFNIGRYWLTSSFKSLYVPYPLLKKGENEIVIFDAISDNKVKKVEFKAEPSLTGPSRFSDPFDGSFEDNVVKN
jgi:beta-galactosidase